MQQAGQWQERVRERTDEIAQMAMNGQTIGEAELTRLQTQTQTYLQQTAALPDPALTQQLEQFQQMAQEQQQVLEQAGGAQTQAAVQTMSWAWQAAQEGLAAPASPTVILRQSVPQPAMLTGTGRLRQRRSPVGIRTIRVARTTPAGLMTLAARTILVGQADQVTRGVPVARITLVVQGTRGAVPAAQAIQAAAPVTLAEIRAVVPVTPAVIPVTPEVEVRNK